MGCLFPRATGRIPVASISHVLAKYRVPVTISWDLALQDRSPENSMLDSGCPTKPKLPCPFLCRPLSSPSGAEMFSLEPDQVDEIDAIDEALAQQKAPCYRGLAKIPLMLSQMTRKDMTPVVRGTAAPSRKMPRFRILLMVLARFVV